MTKFIVKTCYFVIPVFFIHIINTVFYKQTEGDLVRLGYLYANPCPKSDIQKKYKLHKHYTLLSEVNLTTQKKFDIVTIGDSFSEQDDLGYKNFLGQKGLSVLHIDRYISGDNPIQKLIELVNSGLFKKIKTNYIVLQSVEREFNNRTQGVNLGATAALDTIEKMHNKASLQDLDIKFFSDATIKIPLTNIQFLYNTKPKYSQTYKFKSIKNDLFSNYPEQILIYQDDITNLNSKNDSLQIVYSVKILDSINSLIAKQGINLIVLIGPDKYDLYYKYIKNNNNLIKPAFFPIYENLKKEYININSFEALSEKIKKNPDVYFYDDTHWSPIGAKTISDEIFKTITHRGK